MFFSLDQCLVLFWCIISLVLIVSIQRTGWDFEIPLCEYRPSQIAAPVADTYEFTETYESLQALCCEIAETYSDFCKVMIGLQLLRFGLMHVKPRGAVWQWLLVVDPMILHTQVFYVFDDNITLVVMDITAWSWKWWIQLVIINSLCLLFSVLFMVVLTLHDLSVSHQLSIIMFILWWDICVWQRHFLSLGSCHRKIA